MRRKFLHDTNHLGNAVTPATKVAIRLHDVRLQGGVVGTCMPVMCELEAGIRHVRDETAYRENLGKVLKQVRIWPLDLEICKEYGELDADLRRRGRVLSQVDIMLAAMARRMQLVLVTTDRDFEALPDIETEDWTKL